jgi:hypothetical protein
MRQVLGSAPDKNKDCYKDRDPAEALVYVEDFIPTERDNEREDAGDDNADVNTHGAATYSSQGLPTYDGGDNSEPSHGRSVEKQNDANSVETTI